MRHLYLQLNILFFCDLYFRKRGSGELREGMTVRA